jgi:hypothetical protein
VWEKKSGKMWTLRIMSTIREANRELADKYRRFLLHSFNFTLCGVDPIIASKSAELRAQYDLRTPDAIQLDWDSREDR